MNPEEIKAEPAEKSRTHYWKFVTWFLAIVVLSFALLWGLARYERYVGQSQLDDIVAAMKQYEKEDYAAAMADTYGGKTPKETLQLYIAALEKRDYALAAKYFIGGKQEKELHRFDKTTDARVGEVILLLKQALNSSKDLDCDGQKTECAIHDPVYVDTKLYPNGVWKLTDL